MVDVANKQMIGGGTTPPTQPSFTAFDDAIAKVSNVRAGLPVSVSVRGHLTQPVAGTVTRIALSGTSSDLSHSPAVQAAYLGGASDE